MKLSRYSEKCYILLLTGKIKEFNYKDKWDLIQTTVVTVKGDTILHEFSLEGDLIY